MRIGAESRGRAAVGVVVALQIAVPTAAALVGDLPTRFGFQMYSGLGPLPSISIVDERGRSHDVAPADVVAVPRPELNWSSHLPPYLCQRFPSAESVTLTYVRPNRSEEFPCLRS